MCIVAITCAWMYWSCHLRASAEDVSPGAPRGRPVRGKPPGEPDVVVSGRARRSRVALCTCPGLRAFLGDMGKLRPRESLSEGEGNPRGARGSAGNSSWRGSESGRGNVWAAGFVAGFYGRRLVGFCVDFVCFCLFVCWGPRWDGRGWHILTV